MEVFAKTVDGCNLSQTSNMNYFAKSSEAATHRCFKEKRCSENMQQIYSRTLMPKCDFNKVAKQL